MTESDDPPKSDIDANDRKSATVSSKEVTSDSEVALKERVRGMFLKSSSGFVALQESQSSAYFK